MSKRIEELTLQAMKAYGTHQEAQIRECLGKWVSELEPVLIYKQLRFVGLGIATEVGQKCRIVIKVPKDTKKYDPGRFFDHDTLRRTSIDDDDA